MHPERTDEFTITERKKCVWEKFFRSKENEIQITKVFNRSEKVFSDS